MSSEDSNPRRISSSNAARRRQLAWVRGGAVVVATALVATYALSQILARCGHPAVPLDDAFIHFQYARRIAEGRGLSYVDGEGFSSGATSLLWPAALAVFHALGLRELAIIWGAWLLSFAALAGLAAETYRITRPLSGPGEAAGAAAMVLLFGGHVWCAASGMEVVPLAWLLAYAVRSSAEWREAPPDARLPGHRVRLCAVALAAPLMRPEGALASLAVVAALALFPASKLRESDAASDANTIARVTPSRLDRWLSPILARRHAALAAIGPALVPLVNWVATGHATSSTTVVKWLPGNPYEGHGSALVAAVGQNVRLLFETLLDGREWSALFIPQGARPFALAALVAIPAAGVVRRLGFRSALVLLMALGMLLPCTYLTFLWNRLRYLWPFAFAWFVGLACAARSLAELASMLSPRLRHVGAIVSWGLALTLASQLAWTTSDLAQSASAIDRQQVALARWAAQALPKDAVIGVNDTGAIAYLGGHQTFDVVGLTTPGEATYWVAGAGARYEHYERLERAEPHRFPTHFIVYPNWMACDAVLGDELHEATVTDQTILGGVTMTAYATRRDLLHSGALPVEVPSGALLDELDVADLESESAHGYVVGPSRDTLSIAALHEHRGRSIADGLRAGRRADQFRLRAGGPAVLVARLASSVAGSVEAWADDVSLGSLPVGAEAWTEVAWRVERAAAGPITVTVRGKDGLLFASAHYWLFADASAASSERGR